MAELALALNIIEAVKQTYHVAQFIFEAVKSARNEDVERQQLTTDFGRELLFLASFQRYFEKAHGSIAYDQALDELWLLEIDQTVRHMKLDFTDYEKLAGTDSQPSLEKSTSSLPLLLKGSENEKPKGSGLVTREKSSMTQRWKDGNTRIYTATKWALFDRQRLQVILEKFRKRNKALRKILQFAMAGILQQIAQHGQDLKSLQQDKDAVALGLATWAEIKQIKDQPEHVDNDWSLQDSTVNANDNASVVRLGDVCTRMPKSSMLAKTRYTKDAVLVEYKTYPPKPEGLGGSEAEDLNFRLDRRVNQLASLLATSGSNALGTLPFKGFVKEADQRRYAFLFNIPEGMSEASPDSLHEMIESPVLGRLWSLSARFKLASDLATIMGGFHMFEWVVKGFQSQSVVFCKSLSDKTPQLSTPFLAGFEYIRPISGSTVGQPLDLSGKNMLYCHPDLQEEPNIEFSKIHDLYSLGVVLLEIGLWLTAQQLLQQTRSPRPSTPAEIREEYIRKASSKLPLRMGKSYAEAVVACLESRHKHQAIRPDVFLNVFDQEIVQKLSAKRLLD
ncbi:MAG: hypothetical protein LQ350_006259 [Teloschistes chrysophthalmus]|nr:MAG: hypothetical protein LQ350_006259 [Niorma chrysophthalma]